MGRGSASERPLLKPGGLQGFGGWWRVAGEMGAVHSLFMSFPPCHGRTGVNIPKGRVVEDYAVICILGQGLELNGEGDRAAAAESP